MITIIENIGFIEAIFSTKNDAELYLRNHPEKRNCSLKELSFEHFPFYIIEEEQFICSNQQQEILNYIHQIDLTRYSNNEIIVINFYKIKEPFQSKEYNTDNMGLLEHHHLTKRDLLKLKKTKNWSNWMYF